MRLPHMCGEPGVTCTSGMPTFQHLYWDGTTEGKAPPPGSKSPGLQDRNSWALETSLDVEWAHAIAPEANILNVTTNPAETQGVQGFPAMMDAEQFIVDHHQATVISQSFGAVEEGFGSTQALLSLRHAFVSAAASGVTVVASRPRGPATEARGPTAGSTTLTRKALGRLSYGCLRRLCRRVWVPAAQARRTRPPRLCGLPRPSPRGACLSI